MKLTKKVELGLNVLDVLKTKTEPVTTAVLAEAVGTTTHFLEQIMRNLRQAEIVTVRRGPGGGYMLAPSTTLTAFDVVNALGSKITAETAGTAGVSGRLKKSIVDAYLNTAV